MMIGFTESIIAWIASTTIPAFLGLVVIVWAGSGADARYASAFALGIFLWFFVDTIGGSAGLAVNEGFSGSADQIGAVALFIIGLLSLSWIDRNRGLFSIQSDVGQYGLVIPFLVAVAVGIHGLGEGTAFGANTAMTTSTSLLEAFGGPSAGIAYVLHKGLEPMMIGACYLVYSPRHAKKSAGIVKDLALLSVAFIVPSLIGAATGYYLVYSTIYFFSLGTGTSIYAALRLAAPLFTPDKAKNPGYTVRMVTILMLGFMAIYIAALFHS